ncbi:hypothetical protein ABQE57_05940 [Mycolicibacterium elephantis]
MTLDAPLNQRQVDLLRWVSDGCPQGHWEDFTYKTTASALEWRGLITVSKRGGIWTASITEAGAHYLKTGNYPPGHRLHRIRPPKAVAPLAATSPRPPKLSAPAALKPPHKLVRDILDAGGALERDVSEDTTNYKHLVAIINGRNIAPDDAQVIMNDWVKPGYILLRLSSAAWSWKSGTLPQRVSKLHPIVAELRSDNRLDNIGASLRPRAYRLLHALVREAEARGHKVRVSKRPSQYGYGEQVGGIVGCLVFDVNDIRCALSVSEPQDRVPHVATETELAKAKRDPWYRIPTHDHVKSGRLHLTLATDSGYHSKVGWQETKKLRLESRLCDVIPLFEHWAALDAERKEAERQRQMAARERRVHEDAIVLEAYHQQALADRLLADLHAWEPTGRLRAYLTMLSERVEAMTDHDERSAAFEWLEWCTRYVAEHDPAAKTIAMPTVRSPAYGELAEFRRRLGLSGF